MIKMNQFILSEPVAAAASRLVNVVLVDWHSAVTLLVWVHVVVCWDGRMWKFGRTSVCPVDGFCFVRFSFVLHAVPTLVAEMNHGSVCS